MTTHTRTITVHLTAIPASGTPEAADVLKTLIAAAVSDTRVQVEQGTATTKYSPKLTVAIPTQPPTTLFEANAAARYLLASTWPKDSLEALRQNSLLDQAERTVVALLTSKRPDIPRAFAFYEVIAGSLPTQPTLAGIVLFSELYYVYQAASDDLRQGFPALHTWFTRTLADPKIKAGLAAADPFVHIVPVPIYQPATEANRKVQVAYTFDEDRSRVRLPVQGEKNILITSALPYVNNVPHLGNIIGSVLSADVFSRYCRVRGWNSVFICGTDEYGTATETKALEEGVSCQALCDKYNALHRSVYEWFQLDFDHFGRTTTPQQTEIAQDIFHQLHKNGYTSEATMTQLFCEQCRRFLADRYVEGTCPRCQYDDARGDQCDKCGHLLNAADLINPRCKMDGNRPVLRESSHIFLELGKLQPKVEAFVQRASEEGGWTHNGRTITNNWLKEGLKARCITRDLKWGTPVPLEHMKDKVFYVWYDAPIGYPSITANYTSEWAQWWKNPEQVKLYQFMGKDNVPFHTVIFPACELGTDEKWTLLHHISTTEYLNYEGGKFSKSRNVGVFGNNVMETGVPVSVWRYYLLANRPESSDSIFTWDEFIARNNNELLANLGNFCNRVLKFIGTNKYVSTVPAWSEDLIHPPTGQETLESKLIRDVNDLLAQYITAFDAVKLRLALKLAMDVSQKGNGYLQESRLDNSLFNDHRAQCDTVVAVAVNLIYLLSAMLYPFMPTTSRAICRQLNAPLQILPEVFTLAILPGHVVGEAEHLFKRLDEKLADQFRARYGGKH
ncbi:methionine--tRNA ligase mes1 [Dimargaris xerosporica]|nr:methionine--tRNA ligase mes1 [Dimargaris xerosporica]